MLSRGGAPVPSNSRAPVSQSRPRAGAGAAISAGNLCVTSKLPPAVLGTAAFRNVVSHIGVTSRGQAYEDRERFFTPGKPT